MATKARTCVTVIRCRGADAISHSSTGLESQLVCLYIPPVGLGLWGLGRCRRTADKTRSYGRIWKNTLEHRGRRETRTVQHNRVQLTTTKHRQLTSAKP